MQGPVVPDPDIARLIAEPDHVTPERIRWKPLPIVQSHNQSAHNFVEGLITMAGTGDPSDKDGKFTKHLPSDRIQP